MTDKELKEIRERCNKATPGPWKWEETEDQKSGREWGDLGEILVTQSGDEVLSANGYDYTSVEVSKNDAAFIAHAREDIPALLAEIERLTTKVSILEDIKTGRAAWIPVSERLPEPEQRVLVCCEARHYDGKKYHEITTAMHEDGTVWREDSSWNFNEFDDLGDYDEEKDDWRIPEGWWEYTLYNDENMNYPISDTVTHWMPLPSMEGPNDDA